MPRSTEVQRSEAGCIGARMQHDFREGKLDVLTVYDPHGIMAKHQF